MYQTLCINYCLSNIVYLSESYSQVPWSSCEYITLQYSLVSDNVPILMLKCFSHAGAIIVLYLLPDEGNEWYYWKRIKNSLFVINAQVMQVIRSVVFGPWTEKLSDDNYDECWGYW